MIYSSNISACHRSLRIRKHIPSFLWKRLLTVIGPFHFCFRFCFRTCFRTWPRWVAGAHLITPCVWYRRRSVSARARRFAAQLKNAVITSRTSPIPVHLSRLLQWFSLYRVVLSWWTTASDVLNPIAIRYTILVIETQIIYIRHEKTETTMQFVALLYGAMLMFSIGVLSSSYGYEADFANLYLRSTTNLQVRSPLGFELTIHVNNTLDDRHLHRPWGELRHRLSQTLGIQVDLLQYRAILLWVLMLGEFEDDSNGLDARRRTSRMRGIERKLPFYFWCFAEFRYSSQEPDRIMLSRTWSCNNFTLVVLLWSLSACCHLRFVMKRHFREHYMKTAWYTGDFMRRPLSRRRSYWKLKLTRVSSCSIQHNDCSDMSNNKTGSFAVSDCDTQQSKFWFPFLLLSTPAITNDLRSRLTFMIAAACESAQTSATATSFQVLVSQDANFDYICDSWTISTGWEVRTTWKPNTMETNSPGQEGREYGYIVLA